MFKARYTHAGDKIEFNMVDFVESRLLPKPATNRQQSRLLKYTFKFVADTVNFVADTVDFVASVYGSQSDTKSTFNKVDCVEFNFVASVYRALHGAHSPDNVKFPDGWWHSSAAALGMLNVTHIVPVLVLLSVVGDAMQQ